MQENKGYLYSIWGYQIPPPSLSIKEPVIQMRSWIRIRDVDDGLSLEWVYILRLLHHSGENASAQSCIITY